MRYRIPFNSFQTVVYEALKKYQTTAVYDDVPKEVEKPYITLEGFTYKPDMTKIERIGNVSLTMHCWSDYSGKSEVNEMLEDIASVCTTVPLDMSADGYKVIDQKIDFAEALPEEINGYHGVITLIATIQDIEK